MTLLAISIINILIITVIIIMELFPVKTYAVAGFVRNKNLLTHGRLEVYSVKAKNKTQAKIEGLKRLYAKYSLEDWQILKVRVTETI